MAAAEHLAAGRSPGPGCPILRERDQRLESLKRLVDHLGHDFNNMLVPLLGYATLIKGELPPDNPALGYADKLESSARKTEALLSQVLNAVRPVRKFQAKSVDFGGLVREVVEEWRASLPLTVRIDTSVEVEPFQCFCDVDQWTEALRQLLSNARFALAAGGALRVSLERTIVPLERALELNVSPDAFRLTIRDNGFGMPPEVVRRACEPFFTTRPRNVALGLGLTQVHSVTQIHGGQLVLESGEDVGTTVTIWLPAGGLASAPNDAGLTTARGDRSAKVLIVDGDPIVREALKAYLQRLPIEVLVAQNGAEAMRMFQRNAAQMRLVVSDVGAPQMSGVDLYEQLQKLAPQVPMIWTSGDDDGKSESALARFGPERPLLLKKPFSLKAFAETVRERLG